jgi:hypothetical protein
MRTSYLDSPDAPFCEGCEHEDALSDEPPCEECEVEPSHYQEKVDPIAKLEQELATQKEHAEQWRLIALKYENQIKGNCKHGEEVVRITGVQRSILDIEPLAVAGYSEDACTITIAALLERALDLATKT